MKRLAVFASSNASDFTAIQESITSGILLGKCEFVCAIINKEQIGAIDKFRANNIPYYFIRTKDKTEAYAKIDEVLMKYGVDLIICIGWMNIIPSEFINKWPNKILNVHPSYLPSFPGAHAISDAMKSKVSQTGATIHYIDEGIDTGKIILQRLISIAPDDNETTLKAKIQKVEQEIYPLAINEVINQM